MNKLGRHHSAAVAMAAPRTPRHERAITVLLAVLLAALPVGGATAQASADASAIPTSAGGNGGSTPVADEIPMLRPGDSLRVLVWRKPELSGGFVVANDGSVAHPLYQDVHVASVPLHEVRERLRAFILAFERNPQIVVQPLFRVAVGGEVRTPNVYLLPPEATVAGAVALAGGVTERGKSRVVLQRQGRRITVDLNNPRAGGDTMTVRSGDRIIVERRGNVLGILSPLASLTAIAASILVIARQ